MVCGSCESGPVRQLQGRTNAERAFARASNQQQRGKDDMRVDSGRRPIEHSHVHHNQMGAAWHRKRCSWCGVPVTVGATDLGRCFLQTKIAELPERPCACDAISWSPALCQREYGSSNIF